MDLYGDAQRLISVGGEADPLQRWVRPKGQKEAPALQTRAALASAQRNGSGEALQKQ